MINNTFLALIFLLLGIWAIYDGTKKWYKNTYYSINIRMIGVGIMLLIAAIVLLVREYA